MFLFIFYILSSHSFDFNDMNEQKLKEYIDYLDDLAEK